MEPCRLFRIEPESPPVVPRPAHSVPFEQRRHPLSSLAGKRLVIKRSLSMTPTSEVASEGSFVCVPDRQSPGIEPAKRGRWGESLPIRPIQARPEIRERRKGDCVEPKPTAHFAKATGEGLEHPMLPTSIIHLSFAVADAKHRRMRSSSSERPIPQGPS